MPVKADERSSMFREWQRRIVSGLATTAQIRQLCQVSIGWGKATKLTPEEAEEILCELSVRYIGLVARDEQKGIEWLRKYGSKSLGLDQEIIDSIERIEYRGDRVALNHRSELPVWHVILSDGRSFSYWSASWQAFAYGTPCTDERASLVQQVR